MSHRINLSYQSIVSLRRRPYPITSFRIVGIFYRIESYCTKCRLRSNLSSQTTACYQNTKANLFSRTTTCFRKTNVAHSEFPDKVRHIPDSGGHPYPLGRLHQDGAEGVRGKSVLSVQPVSEHARFLKRPRHESQLRHLVLRVQILQTGTA